MKELSFTLQGFSTFGMEDRPRIFLGKGKRKSRFVSIAKASTRYV